MEVVKTIKFTDEEKETLEKAFNIIDAISEIINDDWVDTFSRLVYLTKIHDGKIQIQNMIDLMSF